jgi:diguanylate cyclase (GGDEF)-like protein
MEDRLQRIIAQLEPLDEKWNDAIIQFLFEQLESNDASGESRCVWLTEMMQLIEAVTTIANLTDYQKIAVKAAADIRKLMQAENAVFLQWNAVAEKLAALDDSQAFESESKPHHGTHPDPGPFPPWVQADLSTQSTSIISAEDPTLSAIQQEFLITTGLTLFLWLAVRTDDGLAGGILVTDTRPSFAFEVHQLAMGRMIASCAGSAIARSRVYALAESRVQGLETLRQVSLVLTSHLDLQQVLDNILHHALVLIHRAQDAHIFLYEANNLVFKAALWADGRKGQAWSQPREGGLTYSVARSGELIKVDNMRDHTLYEGAPPMWAGSIVGLPLKIQARVVGVMTIAHPETFAFSKDELHMLRLLGDQAAVAIENARLHDLVNRQARTDMLTGLPNRRAFNEHLTHELHRAERYGHSFSLAVLDLDGFKAVNDLYGHPRGDQVLRKIARHIQASIRNSDYLARFGGDEFVLLLAEADSQISKRLMRRLQEVMEELQLHDGLKVGISYGCATFPDDARALDDLYRIADQALYAKKAEKYTPRG